MDLKDKINEAAMNGNISGMKELLEADETLVNAYSGDGWTPLHLAAHFGHEKSVEFLLAQRADVHARSKNEMTNTALHAATANKHLNIIEVLLDNDSDVNAQQSGGYSALHEAAMLGETDIVQLLFERGADKNLKNDEGQIARDLAEAKHHTETAALL